MTATNLAAALVAVALPITAAETWTLEVDDPRPLMRAIDELQARFKVPIHYEDPPFQHADDMEDVTDRVPQTPQQRAANPGVRFIVPRGGRMSVILAGQDLESLLAQINGEYEARGFPGRFTIVQRWGFLSVEPAAIRSRSGEVVRTASVLKHPVTIPFRRWKTAEYLNAVIQQVSERSGVKIGIAAFPILGFVNTTVETGALGEPAHAALAKLFAMLRSRYSYRLLYDPKLRYYMLSIR